MTPFFEHLIELRSRLLRCVIVLAVLILLFFPFANFLFTTLAQPLLQHLPESSHMIATQVASPIIVPLKFISVLAIFIATPYLLYQLWAFIAPGLYRNEKKLMQPVLLISCLLFYAGVMFAYLLTLPLMMKFFIASAPEGVLIMTDISAYLDFVTQLFFISGVIFEVPLIVWVLVRMNIVSRETLIQQRPYIIIGAFVIGMLLTPPDVLSQILLAIPLWMLFELGLLFTRIWPPKESSPKNNQTR